eukprot:5866995-Pleurochrysis_carterae.AAC.1
MHDRSTLLLLLASSAYPFATGHRRGLRGGVSRDPFGSLFGRDNANPFQRYAGLKRRVAKHQLSSADTLPH